MKKGSPIGPEGHFQAGTNALVIGRSSNGASGYGPWFNVTNRYLGLKFKIKGKTHYGWARLTVTGTFGSIVATLTGYAYETIPNKAIISGATRGPGVITMRQARQPEHWAGWHWEGNSSLSAGRLRLSREYAIAIAAKEGVFMPGKKSKTLFIAVLLGLMTIAAPTFAAGKEKILYSFCPAQLCPDGANPMASLISDAAGNLYGTAYYGGNSNCIRGCGTVFELTR